MCTRPAIYQNKEEEQELKGAKQNNFQSTKMFVAFSVFMGSFSNAVDKASFEKQLEMRKGSNKRIFAAFVFALIATTPERAF